MQRAAEAVPARQAAETVQEPDKSCWGSGSAPEAAAGTESEPEQDVYLIGMLCCKFSQLVHPRIISRIIRAGFLCIAEIDDGLAFVGTIGALRCLVDGTHFVISFQSNNTAFFAGPSGVRLHA